MIDLAAPGYLRNVTVADGPRGEVSSGQYRGCSFATPQVAGIAALLKDWHLDAGNTWINNPGYLHTMMLAMGNRHRGSSVPTGHYPIQASHTTGLGSVKARLHNGTLGAGFNHLATFTFTTNGQSATYIPYSAPMPTGTTFVKCVAFQMEDTSSDAAPVTISDIDLYVRIRDPIGGVCSGSGTLRFERWETDMDWKHMVAIGSGAVTLEGKCVETHLVASQVEGGGITARTMCYSAPVRDDLPN